MIDDDRLARMLRAALPPTSSDGPVRDLWPLVAGRVEAGRRASRLDIGIGLVAIVLLWLFPQAAWLLAYHL